MSLDLINLWDRVQVVSSCPNVGDRWVWVLGRHSGFLIASACDTIHPRSVKVRWTGFLWGGD